MQIGIVSAAHVGVRVREFANHLAQDVGQAVAVGDRRQQLGILVAHLFPVHAVHGRGVEVVALLPPDLVEHLFPLGWRIDLRLHAGQVERAIADFFGTIRLGVDDAVGVAVASALGLIEQLGSVEGEGKALHAFDQDFVLALFQIVNVDGVALRPEAGRTVPGWESLNSR